MASLWVMVQRRRGWWVVTVCNLDPEPEPAAYETRRTLTEVVVATVGQSLLDPGDGKGPRRWGCDVKGRRVLEPGMSEIRLLEVDGDVGVGWGGWKGRLVVL
jgi:hypothetical protein